MEVRDAAGRPLALQNATASTPETATARAPLRRSTATTRMAAGRCSRPTARATGSWSSWRRRSCARARPRRSRSSCTRTRVACARWAGSRLAGTTERASGPHDAGTRALVRSSSAAALDPKARSKDQQTSLAKFYRREAAELAPARAELRAAELERQALVDALPESYVTTTQEPEPVRVLPRGNWLDDSGEVVTPAVPQFLPPDDGGDAAARATRLDLARWLTSRDNPLTARVLRQPAVEALLRPGPLAERRGPGRAGRVAVASGAARLARARVHGRAAGT